MNNLEVLLRCQMLLNNMFGIWSVFLTCWKPLISFYLTGQMRLILLPDLSVKGRRKSSALLRMKKSQKDTRVLIIQGEHFSLTPNSNLPIIAARESEVLSFEKGVFYG
jgi:hypothetical protein